MKAKLLLVSALAIALFSSCYPKENVVKERIVGTWILEEINGKDAYTNDRSVCIFSAGKQIYGTGYTLGENNKKWMESVLPYEVAGHKVLLQGTDIVGITWDLQFDVEEITSDEFLYTVDKIIINGVADKDKNTYLYEKPDENYAEAIVGLWEGKNVTPLVAPEDAPLRRWEYFADGTYKYYTYTEKDASGNPIWTTKEDNNGTYKVYGDLLTCNWSNDETSGIIGTMFESWEIKIEKHGDKWGMEWDGFREGNKMVYFSMTKVEK